jgi:hypothetical protein
MVVGLVLTKIMIVGMYIQRSIYVGLALLRDKISRFMVRSIFVIISFCSQ